MPNVRLALAQTNPVVGDISGNTEQIFNTVVTAAQANANVVLFGEMTITGYPIEDLAARESFITAAESKVAELARRLAENSLGHIAVVVGHPALAPEAQKNDWALAQNCASV
ncbi:MAG: nitrilase-related carbon-nitrogen hydrolase, partial [Rhodoluna sp.]